MTNLCFFGTVVNPSRLGGRTLLNTPKLSAVVSRGPSFVACRLSRVEWKSISSFNKGYDNVLLVPQSRPRMGEARRRGRRAISPIVATVIIIALTLVASYSISRFVFGISPATGNASQVSVTRASIATADFKSSFTATRFTCGSPGGSYLTISNTGTVAVTVTSVTLTWAGLTNSYTLSGTCIIGGLGSSTPTQNVLFYAGATQVLNTDATYGGTFTGTVTLDNGAVLPYSGAFY